MAQIPENECSQETLYEWYNIHDQLAALKAKEILLRNKIAKAYFPQPKEGTNNYPLPDDYVLKMTYKMNREVNEGVLTQMVGKFAEAKINVAAVVKAKPELKKSAYNELTEEQQKLFDNCLIIKPGTPELSIELSSAGKKKLKAQENG